MDPKSSKYTESDVSDIETVVSVKDLAKTKKTKEKRPSLPKKREKKRRQKEVEVNRIPGVIKISLSEATQKILGCVVGENITSEKPWIYVSKELIQDNLYLHDESSEFLPLREQILSYPRSTMLIGFISEEIGGDLDDFYICTTEASTDAVQILINEQQLKQETRLYNSIYKTIKPWSNLGSDVEVNETIPKKNRSLLEVEIESKYPILPFKIQFRIRKAEKARDGYMELLSKDESLQFINCRRINSAVQVAPSVSKNEAQTICTYPLNASTQYQYEVEIDEKVWKTYGDTILKYFGANQSFILDCLKVNKKINLYKDDYEKLAEHQLSSRLMVIQNLLEYMAFNDVNYCKGKMITSASWHHMWTGVVALSYGSTSANIYVRKAHITDEVLEAIHGRNPVMIWSFVDPLNSKLILETHREISSLSFCPFNENLIIGGAVNGQIIIWDITNRLNKIEEQEILTNLQQKYRNFMRSLMGWMKDIQDIKQVRTAAVSDLRYSHTAPVVSIQWISPYEEVARTGKAFQYLEDAKERSLQFMTAGEDGVIHIWDLLKKPAVSGSSFKERRLKRLQKKPEGLIQDQSPFRVLHLNLKPIYKIKIQNPHVQRLMPMSSMYYRPVKINFVHDYSMFKSKHNLCERDIYKAEPIIPKEAFVSKLLIGSMEGDFCEVTWEGRDFDLGALVNSENCSFNQFSKFHDGPILSVARHSRIPITLTTGGKIFAIWSDDLRSKPIFWRRCKCYYTYGSWYKNFNARFRMLRSDGIYELWFITNSSKKPTSVIPISSGILTSAISHPRNLSYQCIGISDDLGNFRIFHFKENVEEMKHVMQDHVMESFVKREVERKMQLIKWQNTWCERYIKKESKTLIAQSAVLEEKAEGADVKSKHELKQKSVKIHEETKQDETKTKKEPTVGRYLEWVKEKEMEKEQERIKQMILKKKNLDTKELERQRKPLLKMEAENEVRKQKQKDRLKNSETIFKETVSMLFPAIVKAKIAPPPDPYAGGDPIEVKEQCYSYYNSVCEQAERFMSNTDFQIDFNWTEVLKEGRRRRRYLDNTFAEANHFERYLTYKSERTAKGWMTNETIGTPEVFKEAHFDEE